MGIIWRRNFTSYFEAASKRSKQPQFAVVRFSQDNGTKHP
jgi:hypothetical protein